MSRFARSASVDDGPRPRHIGAVKHVYVLHENEDWVLPLRDAFQARGIPYEEWFLDQGQIDLSKAPPEGVFYNRMSASSHTRDHRYAPEYTACVLTWLERHDRPVVNGRRALQLEVSKVEQYAALEAAGVRVPRTVAAVGASAILEAAETFDGTFITKHNRAGKGLGVRRFEDRDALRRYVEGDEFEPSIDGVTLLQQYVESPTQSITRVEFVGGELLYAVRVDTSQGFELCPADACRIDDAACPVGEKARAMFEIDEGPPPSDFDAYQTFLRDNDIGIAGIERISDAEGVWYTYDVNTNTNYNADAERAAHEHLSGRTGMGSVAAYLGRCLRDLDG